MKKLRNWVMAALLLVGIMRVEFQTDAAEGHEGNWLTDFPKAQAQAKEQKKLLLIDFTGSDWCPPCKQFKKTVLSSPEFNKFAAEKLVLLEADFPEHKSQPPALKKANDALMEKFKVEAFPTVIVLNVSGKVVMRMEGYDGSSAHVFIKKLGKLKP